MKIGIITPTLNRPLFLRTMVLQMQNQSVKPDIIAIYKNGPGESYKWVLNDLNLDFKIQWEETNESVSLPKAYSTPLKYLISQECTHYFWCDDDDIYFRNHIEESIKTIDSGYDFTINGYSNMLFLKDKHFRYDENIKFLTRHCPGGQSSSMCFNDAFARELSKDLDENIFNKYHADVVLGVTTMKKFKCIIKDNRSNITTSYVCHEGTNSSSSWLNKI